MAVAVGDRVYFRVKEGAYGGVNGIGTVCTRPTSIDPERLWVRNEMDDLNGYQFALDICDVEPENSNGPVQIFVKECWGESIG